MRRKIVNQPVCKYNLFLYYFSNAFFGEVSPEGNRNHYMMCVRSAINYYLRMPERLPLIINTMGWIKGLNSVLIFIYFLLCSYSLKINVIVFNNVYYHQVTIVIVFIQKSTLH